MTWVVLLGAYPSPIMACQARSEKVVRKAIEAGMSSTDALKKYGVL